MSLSNKGAGVDTRLQSVTNALFLNPSDDVVMRTHVEGLTLQTGDILVDAVKLWDGTHYIQFELPSDDGETGGYSIGTEAYNMVFNGTTWDRMRGNTSDGVFTKITNSYLPISKNSNANTTDNRIFVDIGTNGTVKLDATSLEALETITVNQGTAGSTQWKVDIGTNGTVSINQPVAVTQHANSTPWQISRNTTANASNNAIFVDIGNNGSVTLLTGSATIGKVAQDKTTAWTVGLDGGTNTIGNVKIVDTNGNQNDSAHPLYVSGTMTLPNGNQMEISNDVGNPIPISRNTSANTITNPMYVTYGIDTGLNNFTSKNRLKVSGYQINFSHTYQFGTGLDFWDEALTSGVSSIWDPNQSAIRITVGTTQGSKIVRQTRQVMPYVPGRAAQFSMAHEWGNHVIGCRARIGIFDNNNGMYFEDGGDGTYYCVIRSNASGVVVENRKPRSQWNGDRFDPITWPNNNPSGITAVPNTIQLICIDYEWYGAGQVIFSYVMNGIKYPIHTFDNANIEPDVWCSTPFLPIRIEAENFAGSNSTKQMFVASTSWSLEGDQVLGGVPMVIGHARHNLQVKDTFYATISVRLKSSCLNAVNILKRFQLASETANVVFKWKLIINPTLVGAVWTDHPIASSTMQYDTSATSFSGGWVVNEGIAFNNADQFDFDPLGNAFQMARNGITTSGNGFISDIVTLAISSTTQNVYADVFLRWREMR